MTPQLCGHWIKQKQLLSIIVGCVKFLCGSQTLWFLVFILNFFHIKVLTKAGYYYGIVANREYFLLINSRNRCYDYDEWVVLNICSYLFHQQSVAADLSRSQNNICQIASASDTALTSPFENGSNEKGANLMMMRGMTAKNFDPVRYSGRWFEVASLKRGFAGQGQEDCHCTQVMPK